MRPDAALLDAPPPPGASLTSGMLAVRRKGDEVLKRGRTSRSQAGWPDDELRPSGLSTTDSPRDRWRWARSPQAPGRLGRPPVWVELVETALLTLILFALLRMVVLNFRVDGQSMAPSLAHGQYLLVNRVAYLTFDRTWAPWWPWTERCREQTCFLISPPRRGDIVVFWPPSDSERPFIKRVIGLPGERVEIGDGRVVVDGRALTEPYIRGLITYQASPIDVPPGQYYVLGDNRNNSSDSHLFGVLPGDQIIGQAWLSYWPSELWGLVPTPRYEPPSGA